MVRKINFNAIFQVSWANTPGCSNANGGDFPRPNQAVRQCPADIEDISYLYGFREPFR